jgi:hypothetical protein
LHTHVVLQASNDITIEKAVTVNNAAGNGGDLSLQAGRNININAVITTDNANLTAVAGDPAAIAGEREAGIAAITLGSGAAINAGSGEVTLAAVGGNFMNYSGSSVPINASRWFVYSTQPSSNVLNGLSPNAEHYNQLYLAGAIPGYAASGNWMFYSAAPVTPAPEIVLPLVPLDVIVNAQKPPVDFVGYKKLAPGGCGAELFVISSASAVFERFMDAEEVTCELDFTEESTGDDFNSKKQPKCRPDEPQESSKAKTEKL